MGPPAFLRGCCDTARLVVRQGTTLKVEELSPLKAEDGATAAGAASEDGATAAGDLAEGGATAAGDLVAGLRGLLGSEDGAPRK